MSVRAFKEATSHINPSLPLSIPFLGMFHPPHVQTEHRPRIRHALPSVLMRSGTSKGLFLHRHHLPPIESEWGTVLLSAMGSRDGDQKQIDGVGGATSTTSKVAVVSKSSRTGIDVDYTFVQVGVGSEKVDFTGNCGNIASGVGPFALDEGLVHPEPGQTEIDVRIFNTNTHRTIIDTIRVGPDGKFWEDGDFHIGGVKGTASQIKVAFLEPAGSMTGALFPTGNRQDEIDISTLGTESFTVKASLVDAANPFVFVDSATMPRAWHELPRDSPTSLEIIEAIRREGAVKMGLARDTISAGLVRGTPKIAVLSPPIVHTLRTPFPDIFVASYSMGKVHPSFQLTGAVCLSAAVSVPGTIAAEISKRKQFPDSPPGTPPDFSVKDAILEPYGRNRQVTIAHSSGTITTGVKAVEGFDGEVEVQSVSVSRTARRLFEGNVLVNI